MFSPELQWLKNRHAFHIFLYPLSTCVLFPGSVICMFPELHGKKSLKNRREGPNDNNRRKISRRLLLEASQVRSAHALDCPDLTGHDTPKSNAYFRESRRQAAEGRGAGWYDIYAFSLKLCAR